MGDEKYPTVNADEILGLLNGVVDSIDKLSSKCGILFGTVSCYEAALGKIEAHLDWVEKGIAPCTCDQLEPDYRPCAGCEATHSAREIRVYLNAVKRTAKEAVK